MEHRRLAALGVPLPDEDGTILRERDRHTKTLVGIGHQECASMPECQLAFLQALNERDSRWEKRLVGIESRLDQVHAVLDNWIASKGIRNTDSTPAKGALDISAGPVKLRGKAWTVGIVALLLAALLGTIAAGAYVLGEWGRPTATVAPSK